MTPVARLRRPIDDAKCRAWIVERGLDQHPVSGAPLASFGCRKTYPQRHVHRQFLPPRERVGSERSCRGAGVAIAATR
jgi:hypothetical protein